mmetsp:Transcript_3720/g.9727  ORF Transcript_3720/g.9727 Transcript_3720/m.9727 type:complete len:245 (-) Transcript_3720:1866-2600(-)
MIPSEIAFFQMLSHQIEIDHFRPILFLALDDSNGRFVFVSCNHVADFVKVLAGNTVVGLAVAIVSIPEHSFVGFGGPPPSSTAAQTSRTTARGQEAQNGEGDGDDSGRGEVSVGVEHHHPDVLFAAECLVHRSLPLDDCLVHRSLPLAADGRAIGRRVPARLVVGASSRARPVVRHEGRPDVGRCEIRFDGIPHGARSRIAAAALGADRLLQPLFDAGQPEMVDVQLANTVNGVEVCVAAVRCG